MKSTILLIVCVVVPMALSTPAGARGSAPRLVQPATTAVAISDMAMDDVGAAQQKTKKRTAKSKGKGGGHLGHH